MTDSLEAFAGDPAGGRQLRRSLQVLADEYAGTPLGDQVRDVLAGRMSMRELAEDPELATLAQRGMEQWQAEWDQKSPEEQRAEVAHVAELAAAEDEQRR